MDYIKKFTLFGFIVLSTFNCAQCSKNGPQRALDIRGFYQTTEDSELDMDFVIENENNKTYDILITLNRKSPLTEKEKALLAENGFNPQTVKNRWAKPFVLGTGFESDRKKGENYSLDGGLTSQFFVCSPRPEIQPDSKGGLLEAGYCVSGLFEAKSREVFGELTLNVVHNSLKQEADGSFMAEHKGKVRIKYKAELTSQK